MIDVPVEFFLESDHAEQEGLGALAGGIERRSRRNFASDERSGKKGGALIGRGLDGHGELQRAVGGDWELTDFGAIEVKELLPQLRR
jgi:hypothetical protein